jgi:hypothetical protein
MSTITRKLKYALALGGVAVPAVAVHMAHAQSPADFFMQEARRMERQTIQERVVRPPEAPEAVETQASLMPARSYDRVICTRICDGSRLVMAIRHNDRDRGSYEAMCKAAGHGQPTLLTMEKLAPVEIRPAAAATSTLEGRAGTSAAAGSCGGRSASMKVPIFADATLRRGDIVATEDGFQVFTGSGGPPFNERDFRKVRAGDMTARLRGVKVAGDLGQPED